MYVLQTVVLVIYGKVKLSRKAAILFQVLEKKNWCQFIHNRYMYVMIWLKIRVSPWCMVGLRKVWERLDWQTYTIVALYISVTKTNECHRYLWLLYRWLVNKRWVHFIRRWVVLYKIADSQICLCLYMYFLLQQKLTPQTGKICTRFVVCMMLTSSCM